MAATKNQYELSQVIVRRSHEVSKVTESDLKRESDCFFYWIMKQMAEQVEKHWGRAIYILNFRVILLNNHVIVCLRGEYNSNKYVPCLMTSRRQFGEVMKEVTNIINELPNYEASYTRNGGFGDSYMYVTMNSPKNDE